MINTLQNKILDYIGDESIDRTFFEFMLITYVVAFGQFLVSPRRVYLRGREIEAESLKSCDSFEARSKANPYYYNAARRGCSEANLLLAQEWEKNGWYAGAASFYWPIARRKKVNACRGVIRNYIRILSSESEARLSRLKWTSLTRKLIWCCKFLLSEGDNAAYLPLSFVYVSGKGIRKNKKKAKYYLAKACEYFDSSNCDNPETAMLAHKLKIEIYRRKNNATSNPE